MASQTLNGHSVQEFGIISLAASGAPLSIWTLTHNRGARACMITPLDPTGRGLVPDIVVTQPSVNALAIANAAEGPVSLVLRVDWNIPSDDKMADRPATDGVLSGPPT